MKIRTYNRGTDAALFNADGEPVAIGETKSKAVLLTFAFPTNDFAEAIEQLRQLINSTNEDNSQ